MNIRGFIARLEPILASGPLATAAAAAVLAVMIVGAIGTIRTGRLPYRALLVLGALLWPLPDHPLQGPVVLPLSYRHGVHLADLLSIVAVVVAALPWKRKS